MSLNSLKVVKRQMQTILLVGLNLTQKTDPTTSSIVKRLVTTKESIGPTIFVAPVEVVIAGWENMLKVLRLLKTTAEKTVTVMTVEFLVRTAMMNLSGLQKVLPRLTKRLNLEEF